MPDGSMRIALGLEYDGSAFHGWQAQQEGLRSVQACVESALSRVADHPLRVVTAGRTDAGVHAAAQVVHFDTRARREPRAWVFGGNSHLPGDVSLLWARPVDDAFHARFSALARHYRYVILDRPSRPGLGRGRITWCYRPLDVERMAAAAAYLLGTHDFSAYRAVGCQAKSPVRTVHRLDVIRHGQRVVIAASANAFLHHMVRNIAGVLMAIGGGAREPRWAREVLEARDRNRGGVTAPPEGLYLVGVDYPSEYALPAPSLDSVPA
jgi:tRNA pseudouridine38-40 synthase